MSRTADLSVIMPTYNHAQFLPRALDALLTQSVRPRELIVVNDASPDETTAILDRYAKNDPVVKVIHNDRNRGVLEGFRIGLGQATGKYLFCAASDDCVLPGFIEKLTDALERHPEAGLCSSYFSIINGVTGEIRENPSGWCDAPRYFTPQEVESRIRHSSIPGHATIIKRASFEAAGGLLADLEWHSDWFLNFVVAFREGICHVPEMLSLLTDMPASYSNEGHRSQRQLAVINAIFDRLASAEYADVAPSFQRSGVLSVLGAPVMAAAASRTDAWSKSTLSLLNSFSVEQYEEMLDHPEAGVRELAAFFLGAYWREARQKRVQEKDERRKVEQQLTAAGSALTAVDQILAQTRQSLAATEQTLTQREQELAQSRQSLVLAELEVDRTNQTLAERDSQVRYLEARVEQLAAAMHRMESSYFWKSRQFLAHCKHGVLKPLNRRLAS